MITINEAFGYRRSFACVDLGAIKNNFDELKKCLPETTKTMAVVKADAYGHGSVKVAKALADRADYFAVAVIDEALDRIGLDFANEIFDTERLEDISSDELIEFDNAVSDVKEERDNHEDEDAHIPQYTHEELVKLIGHEFSEA
jgi:alanine racemase